MLAMVRCLLTAVTASLFQKDLRRQYHGDKRKYEAGRKIATNYNQFFDRINVS